MSFAATTSATQDLDVSPGRFVSHLRDCASRFFPDLDDSQASVTIHAHAKRHHSQLLQLNVASGETSHNVIYKIPFCLARAEAGDAQAESRPRLFPEAEQTTNGLREFHALRSIEQHFGGANDPRYGVIRVFDLLQSPYVVVMEKSGHPDLKSLLKTATRFHRKTRYPQLARSLHNTGAWLREFHAMPPLNHTEFRHETRDDYVNSVQLFVRGLIDKLGRRSFFMDMGQRLQTLAMAKLPQQIPTAIVHGDFAPRNILVGDNQQITVFDTQRRWHAPGYEDIAYFLIALKASGPQACSQGLVFSRHQLEEWEAEFLRGYFHDEDPPVAVVRLYECLLLLDWWTAISFRACDGTARQRLSLALSNQFLRRHIPRLLDEI